MAQLLSKEEYAKWMGFPETEKISITEESLNLLLEVAREQLNHIKNWKQNSDKKEVAHLYVFNSVETFWDNVALLLHLGKSKDFSNFAFYPSRSCMEIFLQFLSFGKQSSKERDRIAIKEITRPAVRLYLRDKEEGFVIEGGFEKYYRLFEQELNLPDLNSINAENLSDFESKYLKTFPGIKNLCKEFSKEKWTIYYFLYQYLCENAHGKSLSNVIRSHSTEQQEYRRALMVIYAFAKEMLVLVDKEFLESKFRGKVEPAILAADKNIRSLII